MSPAVRVRCLSLGWIQTRWGQTVSDDEERRIREDSLQNRWGTPEDVAGVVSAFCGKQFSYTTGNFIDVDGGFHIQRL
jgi:NAD(P)-dependent dehydrogenase (short-subunit alcohol dehydrogenase family)